MITVRIVCLVIVLMQAASVFLPVIYMGKAELMFQEIGTSLSTADTSPLFEFRPKSLSYLWTNLLPINLVFCVAFVSLFLGKFRLAKLVGLGALALVAMHALYFSLFSWTGQELLVGYYVWLGSLVLLTATAFLADYLFKQGQPQG